jgi:Fe(3+) dicitrate transport protein
MEKLLCIVITAMIILIGPWKSQAQLNMEIVDSGSIAIPYAYVVIEGKVHLADLQGKLTIEYPKGDLHVQVSHAGFTNLDTTFTASAIRAVRAIRITLTPFLLDAAEIQESDNDFKSIDDFTILAARKIDIITPTSIVGNTTTGSARQIFRSVPGLNIWENGDGGLQLSIGGRGMNPNRSSNFNTRQNGYDISADPLGYPESYYTPSLQAVEEIQIIRGAASLQFGPQFGGMINFRLLSPSKQRKWSIKSEQGMSSFGMQSYFNAIGYRKKGIEAMVYYHHRRGTGWREYSKFKSDQLHVSLGKQFKNDHIKFEYTFAHSLAQQPGGLTDVQFTRTPFLALRERNWFEVDWHLFSITYEHTFNSRVKWQVQPYLLSASRSALGILDKITRADNGGERDLIQGTFNNIGLESRLSVAYDLFSSISSFIGGVRIYHGSTTAFQGLGSDGSDANFSRGNGLSNSSDFGFKNRNISLFAENVVRLGGWTLTPGVRYEFISTQSAGSYTRVVYDGAGNLLPTYPRVYDETDQRDRSVFLYGFGVQREIKGAELYASATRNYRAINFSDIRISNPNQLVDSGITDEHGYTLEVGVRKKLNKRIGFDLNAFQVTYNDKIGNISDTATLNPILGSQSVQVRKNISKAIIRGVEFTANANTYLRKSTLQFFTTAALLDGRYVGDENLQTDGNRVEYAPTMTLRGGITYERERWTFTWMSNYVASQYSDASNSPFGSDPNAVVGAIPAFSVHDIAVQVHLKSFKLTAGIDNLTDASYFTRRASGYPGPGIIPADPRSFHVSIAFVKW